jgi:uncharacterized protein YdhG (YjbR/CyaY superfamily)
MQKKPEVDRYIAGFPEAMQMILQELRTQLAQMVPAAEECVSYGIPTLKLEGNLVHYAGYKNHIGFYPGSSGIEHFQKELSIYKNAKGSVQFPIDQPLPLDLVQKIVKFRVEENLGQAALKAPKKATPKPEKQTDKELVDAHIRQLDPESATCVERIRQIILSTDQTIGERIKWNNPSFYYTGEMKPFNPKEYKREIAVLNLYKGRLMVVFPSGGKVKDPSGILEGDYPDGRRIAVFKDLEDIKSKEAALRGVINDWLDQVEK